MTVDQVHSPASGRVSGWVGAKEPNTAAKTCSRNSPDTRASTTRPMATIREFVIVESEAIGRPARTRTWNMRFWRPPLYHWSYWPKARLLRLLVIGVLAAPRAELGQDQLVGHGPLVLGRRVIPVPAHRALERDDGAVHLLLLLFAAALEPTTRIELVTSSLPRKCSAD